MASPPEEPKSASRKASDAERPPELAKGTRSEGPQLTLNPSDAPQQVNTTPLSNASVAAYEERSLPSDSTNKRPQLVLQGSPNRTSCDNFSPAVGLEVLVSKNAMQLAIPWNMRRASTNAQSTAMWLDLHYIYLKFEFAMRVAIIGVLPASYVNLLAVTGGIDYHPVAITALPIMAVIVAGMTLGESVSRVVMLLKAMLLALPLSLLFSAFEVWTWPTLWTLAAIGGLVTIGYLSDELTRKLALYYFIFTMVAHYSAVPAGGRTMTYILWYQLDLLVGFGFGLLTALLPYPHRAIEKAKLHCDTASRAVGIALCGICLSFWADTNFQRTVNLVRIRKAFREAQEAISETKIAIKHAWYEPMTSQKQSIVLHRVSLLGELMTALSSMINILESIAADPSGIEGRQSLQMAEVCAEKLGRMGEATDAALFIMSSDSYGARSCDHDLERTLAALIRCHDELNEAYLTSRAIAYWNTSTPAAFPQFNLLRHFFFFTLELSVNRTIETLQQPPSQMPPQQWVVDWLCGVRTPVSKLRHRLKLLLSSDVNEVIRLREAIKVSVSMMTAIGFFFYTTGTVKLVAPAIISFVSATDNGEAVWGSMQRLLGALLGGVLAFFMYTITPNSLAHVSSLVLLVGIASFFRTGKEYGIAAFYSCFVIIPILIPGINEPEIQRLNESCLGVIIYFVIVNIFWPSQPSVMLTLQRVKILKAMRECAEELFRLHPLSNCLCIPNIAQLEKQLAALKNSLETERKLVAVVAHQPTCKRGVIPVDAHRKFSEYEHLCVHAVEVTFAASKSLILLSSGNDRQLLVTPQSIRIHDTLAKDISAMAELLCAVISDPYSPYDDALVKTGLDLKRHADELRRARNEMVFQAIKSAPRSEGQVPVPTRDIDAYSTIVVAALQMATHLHALYYSLEALR